MKQAALFAQPLPGQLALDRIRSLYFRRLKAFWAVGQTYFYRLSRDQAVKSRAPERDHVNEHIAIGTIRADEAEAFMRIEPLHRCFDEVTAILRRNVGRAPHLSGGQNGCFLRGGRQNGTFWHRPVNEL